MSITTQSAGENWMITPAPASPFGVPPANIQQQQWMLVLSGVTILSPRKHSGQKPRARLARIARQLADEVDGAGDHERQGPQPHLEAEAVLRGRHARVDDPAQEIALDRQEDPQEDPVPLPRRRLARPVRWRLLRRRTGRPPSG